jgi:hypothetical protein
VREALAFARDNYVVVVEAGQYYESAALRVRANNVTLK